MFFVVVVVVVVPQTLSLVLNARSPGLLIFGTLRMLAEGVVDLG